MQPLRGRLFLLKRHKSSQVLAMQPLRGRLFLLKRHRQALSTHLNSEERAAPVFRVWYTQQTTPLDHMQRIRVNLLEKPEE